MATFQKRPPPESQDAVQRRLWVVLSFWGVVLFLGLPVWWKTTSIYRAQLPFEHMLQLLYHPQLPLDIRVSSKELASTDLVQIANKVQQTLDDLNEYPVIHHRIQYEQYDKLTRKDGDAALHVEVQNGPKFQHRFDETATGSARLIVQYPASQKSELPHYLANHIHDIFLDEHISAAYQYTLHSSNAARAHQFLQSAPQGRVQDVQRRMARAFKYSGNYHLTFSLFTASGSPSDWAIESIVKRHIQPLIQALSHTSNFSITSQVQLYSPFSPSVHPIPISSGKGAYLRQDELSAFINAAEWPLSPSIGSGPTINFILYVPSKEQMPLLVEGSTSNSWLIPQWGGIAVLNPVLAKSPESGAEVVPAYLDETSLAETFDQFSVQLSSLLGFPSGNLPLSLRIQSHQRIAGLSLFLRASSSLGSLARLAGHLATIPIPRQVSSLVDDALSKLAAASADLGTGKINAGVKQATSAFGDAEKAFFDKSMVGQVYFPEEHKVAVYLPLMGPVCVPLAVALLREIKRVASTFRR